MRTGHYRWVRWMTLLLLALPLIAACGDSGDDADTGSAPAVDESATSTDVSAEDSAAVEVDFAPEIGTIDNWYNGGPTSLSELRGSPVLLVFWADY